MGPLVLPLVAAVAAVPDVVLPATDCPALFGSPEERAARAAEREADLVSIERSPHRITIVTHAHWRQPKPIELLGVEIEATYWLENGEGIAIFAVGPEAEVDCPVARYVAQVDRALGQGTIIAILDGIVLLEIEEDLRYMAVRDAAPEVWTVTWQSEFALEGSTATETPTQAGSPPASFRRR